MASLVRATLRRNWSLYAIEAFGLGAFMASACAFTVLLEHPASALHSAIHDALVRRSLVGLAMGATLVALVYSPWGKRSGAHLNPVLTLTFYRLGKVAPVDAVCYATAQFLGGLAGVLFASAVLPGLVADRSIRYAITTPGEAGTVAAFVAETLISFAMMLTVLVVSNSGAARWTGLIAGLLVAAFITFEAPLSGMSMNPARTVASALPAGEWRAWWLYFVAPALGMFVAAELYMLGGARRIVCAKLHHQNPHRCAFCEFQQSRSSATGAAQSQEETDRAVRHAL